MRAFIRGKVCSLRLTEPDLSPEDERRVIAEARAYFDLAWSYTPAGAKRRFSASASSR